MIFARSFMAVLLRRSVHQHAGDEARQHAERGEPGRLVELLPGGRLAGSSAQGPTAVAQGRGTPGSAAWYSSDVGRLVELAGL